MGITAVFVPLQSGGPARSPVQATEGDPLRPDHPDEAISFRNLQLEDEKKRIPADGLLKAKAQLEVMKSEQASRATEAGKPEGQEVAKLQPSDWVSIGPGNVGGRIRAMAIDPNNANNIFIGSASGGIWRSTDAGSSWAPVDDFMANLAVSSLIIDPVNPAVMYAGTGESFTVSGLRGLGVFKSTDGGVTWSQLPATNPADPAVCAVGVTCPWFYVNRLTISPDGATILAATGSSIWRSADAGTTWTQAPAVSGPILDIDFHPTNSQQGIAGNFGAAAFTIDGGTTWTAAAFSPAIASATVNRRVEVAYAPSSPNIVYASVNINRGDIYRSTDGGQNYVRVQTGSNYLGAQGNYDNIIWVNPQDPNSIVVGGIDLWRSTNASTGNPINLMQISQWQCGSGQNTACADTSAHADHHMIVAAPGFNNTTNRRVYFGNDGGIYRTDDILGVGLTNGWVNLNNNLRITQFYSGTAGPGLTVIGGTQDNGNLRADANTNFDPPYDPQGWDTPIGAEGDGGFVAIDPRDGAYVYAEFVYLTISRSSNGGGSFTPINAGIADATCTPPMGGTCTPPANFIAPFILDPNNSERMLAGGLSLWRSNDVKSASAPTWAAIKPAASNGLPAPNTANVPISAIAVAENNSDLVVVGHNDGQIFLTSNGTATSPTWSQVNVAPLPSRFVTRLVIDATKSPNWIYVTFGGFSPDNVYVTKDLGANWTDLTGTGATGLPDVPVRSLVINPVRSDLIYVGTEIGIFASEDAGATWQLPHGGPANVSVDELFWRGGYLAAATYGRGIYTTKNASFLMPSAVCSPGGAECPNSTNCYVGIWECGCTWPNGRVPGPDDDVVVTCPMTIRGNGGYARNLKVNGNGRISLPANGYLQISETLANYGTIDGGNITTKKNLVNGGIISTGLVWLRSGGDIINTGVISSSAGWGFYSGEVYPVQANNITLGGEGSLIAQGVLCNGNLTIGPEASLRALSASTEGSYHPTFFLHGNATNEGLLDVRGEFALSWESQTFSGNHTFSGLGEWRLGAFIIGNRADPFYGPRVNILLASDLTLEVTGLTGYGNASFLVASNGTIQQNNHTLTLKSPSLLSYGQYNLGTAALNLNIPYIKTASIVSPGRYDGLPGFRGTGSVNFTAPGDTYLGLNTRVFEPAFHLAAGTLDGTFSGSIDGTVTIDAGAVLNLNGGTLRANGDVTVDGTIAKTSAANLGGTLAFRGSTLTNNGSISGDSVDFNYGVEAVARNQTIAGTGAWPSGRLIRVGFVNVPTTLTLANDVTLNWSKLGIWAGSSIRTDGHVLTMPCSTAFDASFADSSGGEIIGSVRRTDIATCAGAIPFGSPLTTLQFNSGTPPVEVVISSALTPPAGLTNGVLRSYQIEPIGGRDYSATLRLRYQNAETNGNNESSLALWRHDGTNWVAQGATARDINANWVELSGVTAFSPWGLASCTLSLPSDNTSVAAGGGIGSFDVQSRGTCGWSATSNAAWITIDSGALGSGDGIVNFTAAANTGTARSGTITITGAASTQVFYVSQGADCSGLSITPTTQDFAAGGGGPNGISVTSPNGCPWAATTADNWIYLYTTTGNGNGSVPFYVYGNSGPARTGTINISGQAFTVTQASGCSFYLDPAEQKIGAAGGTATASFSSVDGCPWTVTSNDSWISVTSPSSGTGSSAIAYSVASNPGPPRRGTVTIADQTLTVRQGSGAALSLVVTNANHDGAGSFRQAILDANENVGQTNTISFNIPGSVTITPEFDLPIIDNPVAIEATNSDGRRVVLDGNGNASTGLYVAAPDSTVRGLCIVRFYDSGIAWQGNGGVVENCYLGTDAAGTVGLGNGQGIQVSAANVRVGGSAPGSSNVISGNTWRGLSLYGGPGITIQNNYIGTNPAGAALGNAGDGIGVITDGSIIGGTAPGTGNVIAFNGGNGIGLYYGNSNSIRGNSIFGNTGLGIDINNDGISANGRDQYAPNQLQEYPVLTAAPGASNITGTLNSLAATAFTIEFFVNEVCDSAGNGEGRKFLGTANVTTDPTGTASVGFTLPLSVGTGSFITATATDAAGNTSEFSPCVEVNPVRIQSLAPPTSGHVLLQGIGVPDEQHTLEILPSLSGTATPITISITVDSTGRWQYDDTLPAGLTMRFYRLRFP